jgi:hypothetical protein
VAIGIGIAVNIALDPARHHLCFAILAIGGLYDAGNEQGLAHHLPHYRAFWILRHSFS